MSRQTNKPAIPQTSAAWRSAVVITLTLGPASLPVFKGMKHDLRGIAVQVGNARKMQNDHDVSTTKSKQRQNRLK